MNPTIIPKRPPKMMHQQHCRQLSNGLVNPLFEAAVLSTSSSNSSPQHQHRQHQLNAALFSSNPPQYLVQAQQLQQQNHQQQNNRSPRTGPLNLLSFEGIELIHHNANRELHQAEKLAIEQNKNAFQFDTITPKDKGEDGVVRHAEEIAKDKVEVGVAVTTEGEDLNNTTKTLESSSDDSGGFVSLNGRRGNRVKRATVVGNPMFSNTPDSELGPGESIGLDDLDMDYEQIMHYFDNLKESNA